MACKYDHEYKIQAVKLDIGEGSHTSASATILSEEIALLHKRIEEQDKAWIVKGT